MMRLLYPLGLLGVLLLGWFVIAEPSGEAALDPAALRALAEGAVPHEGGRLVGTDGGLPAIGTVPGGGRVVCGWVERAGARAFFYVVVRAAPMQVDTVFVEGRDGRERGLMAGFCPAGAVR